MVDNITNYNNLTTEVKENLYSMLRQAQTCGGIKPVNEMTTFIL